MKKQTICMAIACPAAVAVILAGCAGADTKQEKAYRAQGISQLGEGEYGKAAESFQKALEQSNGRVSDIEIDICFYKALAQYKNGDTQAATKTYSGILTYDSKNWKAYYLRGSLYLKQSEYGNCLKDYEKAVTLEHDEYGLYINIYENLSAAGHTKKGLTYLKEASSIQGDSADDNCEKGYIAYLLGDTDTAENKLKDAASGGSEQALLYLGSVYADAGDTVTAKTYFDDYMDKNEDDSSALQELGETAYKYKVYDGAVQYFEKALSLVSSEKGSSASEQKLSKDLIASYEYAGDFDKAYSLMESYVKEYPNDESAAKELTFLKTRKSD